MINPTHDSQSALIAFRAKIDTPADNIDNVLADEFKNIEGPAGDDGGTCWTY